MSYPTPHKAAGMAQPSRLCQTAPMASKRTSSAAKSSSTVKKGGAKKASAQPKVAAASTLAARLAAKSSAAAGMVPRIPKAPKLSPEEAFESLRQLGIITPTGKLTALYR